MGGFSTRFAARESEGREAKHGCSVKKQVFDGLPHSVKLREGLSWLVDTSAYPPVFHMNYPRLGISLWIMWKNTATRDLFLFIIHTFFSASCC
jgi:hypothetical protein